MFNCKIFSDLIVAVTVPCGNTICNTHIKNYKDKFGCQCCKRQHEVPNEGYAINELIQTQLILQLSSIADNPHFEECKIEIELAKASMAQIEEIELNSEGYIYNYFEDMLTVNYSLR